MQKELKIPQSICEYFSFKIVQVIYGGRVIDSYDRRLTQTYMDEYLGDFVFDEYQSFHFYTDSIFDYTIPDNLKAKEDFLGEFIAIIEKNRLTLFDFQFVLGSVDKYPLTSPPQLCGLHKNAEIGYNNGMVKDILNNLLAVQSMKGNRYFAVMPKTKTVCNQMLIDLYFRQ